MAAGLVCLAAVTGQERNSSISISPASLSFSAVLNGASPASQTLAVSSSRATRFAISASGQSNGRTWLTISPSGSLTTDRKIAVSVDIARLPVGAYKGSISISGGGVTQTVQVTLTITSASVAAGGYKLIGWNDLGMHCMDGKDYSIFAVLPPYNTIHAHLLDAAGRLVNSDIGYTVTYQAVTDPLTDTINTRSATKTNFWSYAAQLGFGSLTPDVGLKGYAMPVNNVPQAMKFASADNTWLAEGIPVTPYADNGAANYFPMMRLTAKDALNRVLATADIVTPVSDEMNCALCHASNTGSLAARPSAGWVNNADAAKDIKLNILGKHDDRFAGGAVFKASAARFGYNPAGLIATVDRQPVLCATCHASNALGLAGYPGIPALTTSVHGAHAGVLDPTTGTAMDSATTRDSCYRCHPGESTKCLRGAMGVLKTSSGANAIECQSCHGSLSSVALANRSGWLDEPGCQSCHTGTAVKNSGQIAYTSVFASPGVVRAAADATFATNANTPAAGLSLYRFSKGHGGLQCESCHGSTHAEYTTSIVNDNVQSTALQGHSGMLSECSACHNPTPSTVSGGPHGLHPIGASWVGQHEQAAESNRTACQACHGADYRGTILSKMQADRTLAGRAFKRGEVIGCYSCHNGPNGG